MSELMSTWQEPTVRRSLLTTVSAIALMAVVGSAHDARADDSDRPTVWIEGGWHYEGVTGKPAPYNPAFFDALAEEGFASPAIFENPMPYSYGAEGKISLQPEASDWVFSVAARYGRSGGSKTKHEEKPAIFQTSKYGVPGHITYSKNNFADTKTKASESHLVLDFQVGKDVGLGIHSGNVSSVFNFGVRFAQFRSNSHATLAARPRLDANIKYFSFLPARIPYTRYYHRYDATASAVHSFSGIGPSISWNASAGLVGNQADGEIAFDWGINASLLFGRQKVTGTHQTRDHYYRTRGVQNFFTSVHTHTANVDRSRRATVPNLGGFAGVSYRFTNAKLSMGYRADFFFNAMDGGVDAVHSMTRDFYGPYASIGIGLGD